MALPLFGIGIAQTAYYFRSFRKDSVMAQIMIAILFVIDTAQTACTVKSTKDWFLIDLLGPTIPVVFVVGMLCAYTTIFIVQCAYASRLWSLSAQNKTVTSVVLLLALGQLAGGMGQTVNMFIGQSPSVAHTSKSFDIFGKIELSCSLACDVVITAGMVHFLRSSGGNSVIRRTSDVVNKIITYSISVGVGTALNIALWLAMPQNFDFLILHLVLSKLYFNSLLVMLNARVKLREQFCSDNPTGGL
ncbi:hypothetical protein DFH06DRAFT_1325900 [Mycena polygramma]|nr:hypothetical protein DFH06DRAFT_1325900 [Mycena polygramma]